MDHLTMDNVSALSVQYWHFSLDYFLDSMVKCGIRNIEFWPGEPHYYRGNYTSSGEAARAIRALRAKMEQLGLKVVMFTPETLSYPFNPAGNSPSYRSRTLDMYKAAMDDALEFGTNQMFCNAGWGVLDRPRQESWDHAVETIRSACAHAARMGMELNLEALQPYESNLVNSAADLARFLSDVGADNLYAVIDLGAMATAGDTIETYFEALPGRIRHLHFCDRNHEVPGDRDLPLAHCIDYLNAQGFDRYLSLEVFDDMYLSNPHEAYLRSAEWLRRHLS